MHFPSFFYPAKKSGTRPLLSIPEEQISTLYAITIHPGRANHTFHGRLSQSLRPLLSISGEQILILYPRLYHSSWGSRSHTVWMIKPITKIRVIRLLQPTSSTARQNPRNPPKIAQKSHYKIAVNLPLQIHIYLAHVRSHYLFLSTTRPKSKLRHPLPYCLPAVFHSKQRSTTPPQSKAQVDLPHQSPV